MQIKLFFISVGAPSANKLTKFVIYRYRYYVLNKKYRYY